MENSEFIRNEKSIKEYVRNYPVSFMLILICLVMFLIEYCVINFGKEDTIQQFFFMLAVNEGLLDGEIWRIITSPFAHVNLLHLSGNIGGLLIFSSFLESRIGLLKYCILFLGSICFVGIVVAFIGNPAMGMSGFIFSCLMYCLLYSRQQKNNINELDKKMVFSFLIFNIVITFIIPNISISGHLSGLLIGAVSYYIFEKLPLGR